MSTIKVDTIATRTGSGNITLSNTIAGTSATLSGDLTVDTSTLKVDATNNRVLIGTTTEGSVGANQLTVADSGNTGITIRAGTSSASSIYMSDATSGAGEYSGYIAYSHASDSMAIAAAGGQRIRIDADGLKFGSDTAAANALDDFEEGSWTPTTTNATGYSAQFGRYVKVGKLVFINGNLHTSTTSAPGAVIDGLPFASSNTGNSAGNLSIGYYSNIAQHVVWIGGYVLNNSTTMYIVGNSAGHTGTTLQRNGFNWASGSSRVMFSGVYETDS